MGSKPSVVTDSSAQEGKMLNDSPSDSGNFNSIRSPFLAKTNADIFDFFNVGDQDLKRGSRTIALKR